MPAALCRHVVLTHQEDLHYLSRGTTACTGLGGSCLFIFSLALDLPYFIVYR
jgi:hypothetical protein